MPDSHWNHDGCARMSRDARLWRIRSVLVVVLGVCMHSWGFAQDLATKGPELAEAYCASCHSGEGAEAELDLERLMAAEKVDDHLAAWDKMLDMVQSQTMPPNGEDQPSAEERALLLQWMNARLATYDCNQLRPGRVTIRRLNRIEYNNTVRDLVGVDFRPGDDFPSDDVGHGFDNIGDVLTLSPILVEKYLGAAEQIVQRALEDRQVRQALIVKRPNGSTSLERCARENLARFATRAFRRPATREETYRLLRIFRAAGEAGYEGDQQYSMPLQAILVSPHFLFRVEKDPAANDKDGIRPLDDYELASRLSYFLWSSMPDDQLFRLAEEGKLHRPEVLVQQVRRMLQHPSSAAFVENFGGQWLTLRGLAELNPDPARYPSFDDGLREAMMRETYLFFGHVLRENRSVLDFLDADYTFVNEQLAAHYGMQGVQGDKFRQVTLRGQQRRGVLTQASILTLTSNPTRTSPVKRGKWVLENFLGSPPPPPPPGVEELNEDDGAELLGSLRERMQQHRADPSCATCHRRMDTLGFGLENFDAVGAWRTRDGKFDIDPAGDLPGSGRFDDPVELMSVLRETKREEFCRCLTKKMLTYALGRGLEPFDRCAVTSVMKRLEADDYRFQSMIEGIVLSDPFRYREAEGDDR